jgi:nuclear pore complex protein Nup133
MLPSEALGVYTDTVDSRFNDMEKAFRDRLAESMKWEDSILKKHIEKHRLEQWLRSTAETAAAAIRIMADEATMAGAEANGIRSEEEQMVDMNGSA